MFKKISLVLFIVSLVFFVSGCGNKTDEKKDETINPFSPSSMVNTYDRSKGRINDAVDKENERLRKNLQDSGLQ